MSSPIRTLLLTSVTAMIVIAASSSVRAQNSKKDILFAEADGHSLKLDFYPAATSDEPSPLIVWVHGGAWRAGSKSKVPILAMTERGFAVASVEYRLSGVARFPAQIHDIKAAIRFLRARAEEFEIDPNRFVVAGASAGGHLAALVGVSGNVSMLEGDLGNAPTKSSAVQVIVSFYGASNLETILAQSTPHGLSVRVPALKLLLGDSPDNVSELARLASPVRHVDKSDPPLMLLHGDQDPQMPINQSHELQGKYDAVGVECRFKTLHGAAHGGRAFYQPSVLDEVAKFIRDAL